LLLVATGGARYCSQFDLGCVVTPRNNG
jgi:hypothetical protein